MSSNEEKMRNALERIERWFGEFPETGQFWDNEKTQPMSYSACWGSNGERDFMRKIARDALKESSMGLDSKLDSIRYCIKIGAVEDAQEHIFDLLRGLPIRDTPDSQLTPDGLQLKALWSRHS